MNRLVTIVVAATLTLGVSALLAPSSSAQQTPCAGEKCVTEGVAAANGRGSAADPTRAIALFESGCVQGVKASCAHEALMRLAWQDDGEAVSRTLAALTEAERERLRAVYTADCDEGAMRACFHVGVLQEGGFAAPKDTAAALERLSTSCNAGVARACYREGKLMESGPPGYRDVMQARELYRQACNGSDQDACYSLGMSLLGAEGAANREQAEKRFVLACESNHPGACRELGKLHLGGKATASDAAKGKMFLEQACKAGDAEACTLNKGG
ncbi:MAG: sel1 repeat family protein [Deltaproteobacteria bacterium]|nr:sel1 repeat family protein [Deltaproteobacteria bacterium]MBK9371550.1 sel1 repeat family protein [Deltaproteobacteria bacterium]